MNLFYNPVKTTLGVGSFGHFKAQLSQRKGKRILLISGKKSVQNYKQSIYSALENTAYIEISNIEPNPDIKHIYHHISTVQELGFQPDCIAAIGGGSVIDTAKAMKAFLGTPVEDVHSLRRLISEKKYYPFDCEIIACPTTAGTGSEVTKWATVWDGEKGEKYSVDHDKLYPDYAYVDSQLTYAMPIKQAVSCALDAFSHALESYWAKSNCNLSKEYALTAMRIFVENSQGLLEEKNLKSRDSIALSSYLAGLAFSHTRTTVSHAISYPLTALYNIPHGVAVSLSLPYVFELNKMHIAGLDQLYKTLQIKAPLDLQQMIHGLLEEADIPMKLSDYGCGYDDLKTVASKAIVPGRSDNTPVLMDEQKILSILEKIY